MEVLAEETIKHPFSLTNSEMAQVRSFQQETINIFQREYKSPGREEFYTNIESIARFCMAREFEKKKVLDMWRKWVEWYESKRPDLLQPSNGLIERIHSSGKYRLCGYDKSNCPVLVIRMQYHIKGLATAEENLQYLLFMMEKGVQLAKEAGTYQLCVIYDRREMAESDDVSKESMKLFMPILNDNYPEVLKSFYVLGANFFYRAMWKVVSLFVSKRTESKIHLLEDPEILTEYISKDQLAKEYGGNIQLDQSNLI